MEFPDLPSGDLVALYGLASVMLLAGVSKFLMPELWLGFKPQWLGIPLSLTDTHFNYLAGGFEALLGFLLAIRYRARQIAAVVTFWLASITVIMASMNLWLVALRDLGLTALAASVALEGLEA